MYRSLFICFISLNCFAQSWAPNPGQMGSTAMHKDSSVFVGWADNVSINRGWARIDDTTQGKVSYGLSSYALGKPEGDGLTVVSLGDRGEAVLYFAKAIRNDVGPDFAIFENGFADNYLELAYVEVSNDGLAFHRFPCYSETPTTTQSSNATYTDTRYIHNLAGKYKAGYGTPFDLSDLDSVAGLDLNQIHYVRLIDVVGSIDPSFASYDSQGRIINDPWPTNFESGGFDLDGVGIIHQQSFAGTEVVTNPILAFQNPFHEQLIIRHASSGVFKLISMDGKIGLQGAVNQGTNFLCTEKLQKGIYIYEFISESGERQAIKIQKQ